MWTGLNSYRKVAWHPMRSLLWFTPPLLLACAASSAGQYKIIPGHSHDIWDVTAGFPGGYVYSMTQSPDGYLWIGTSNGLVRYDGLTFVSIRLGDSAAETRAPVVGLVTDSSGQLWATDDFSHLFRYAVNRLVGPLADNGKHQHRAAAVASTRDGWLLFASDLQGLIEYERGVAHVLLDPATIPNYPTALAQTADGTISIGTREAGVFRLNLTRGSPEIRRIAGLPDAKINCLLPVSASTLLLGTGSGLLSLHNGKLIQEVNPELRNLEIFALATGQDGNVWIGTDGRLFKAAAKDIDVDGRIHVLDHLAVRSAVTSLFEDRAGDLWIGGPETIERYRASGFTSYLSSAGLPCSNCGSIYVDEQGTAWFAPWDGGLFRLSHDRIEQIKVAGLVDDTVYSIAGGKGEVWLARKYGGVTRLRLHGGALQTSTYTLPNGLAQDAVYSIYRAPDGTVWAGTLNQGLSRFRGGKWSTFTTRDGLPSNTVFAITGNAAGEIYVGTTNGLASLRKNRWVTYSTHDGLPPGAIESLFLDEAGTLWIGTEKGISFLQSGTVHVPIAAPDALYGEILGIAGSNGWLWITTGNHVLRVRCSALLNDSFMAGDYREFGVTDGLPSVEGVKRSHSVVEDNRGWIWFSLNQGISVLQPSVFDRPASPVTIRLDAMLIDGRLVTPGEHIRVPAGRRRLAFRYAGVNVSNPEAVRYRYRLDNQDPVWSEPTALREVDYTNTPPGRYQFHVTARNPDGVWSPQESAIIFDVEPAFWQALWFQLASVATLLLLAFGLYRQRLRQMATRADLRYAERLAERTRIAQELHDTLLQGFLSASLQVHVAVDRLPDDSSVKPMLTRALELMRQVIDEGRNAVRGLRSSPSASLDLEHAFSRIQQELVTEQHAGEQVDFRVVVEGQQRPLHPVLRDEVYRIGREALLNAFRHARARKVEIEIRYSPKRLGVTVRDNGRGIDPGILQTGREGHWGLSVMRERADRMGARLRVTSSVKAGTEVELSVPGHIAFQGHPKPGASWFAKPFRVWAGSRRGSGK